MSSNPRPQIKGLSLKRVTADTPFTIDYEWWQKSELDLKTYLFSRLSIEAEVEMDSSNDQVDLVDAETGEVVTVDGFEFMVQTYFNQLPEDFAERMSLVDAVFCVLLANANRPMTVWEIANKVKRPVDTILRTVGGPKIYLGIRPVPEEE
ncbi:MAG: hypothetical protein HND44_14740 [Chloroflexi bacterium]|nr:hypothetical protein [Ardenticatenaceae bacterium]MBL1129721.1 hypothetical protein [Chloroflexota bacterium]NOG35802.1 hypothetical protein [Chloroflexota bacterium]GIK57898.1 MAG: hypothetical protein BroJett015_35610 [Chloroflexota bacterium]